MMKGVKRFTFEKEGTDVCGKMAEGRQKEEVRNRKPFNKYTLIHLIATGIKFKFSEAKLKLD